jgi:hypothetical protein
MRNLNQIRGLMGFLVRVAERRIGLSADGLAVCSSYLVDCNWISAGEVRRRHPARTFDFSERRYRSPNRFNNQELNG